MSPIADLAEADAGEKYDACCPRRKPNKAMLVSFGCRFGRRSCVDILVGDCFTATPAGTLDGAKGLDVRLRRYHAGWSRRREPLFFSRDFKGNDEQDDSATPAMPHRGDMISEVIARVAGWDQLARVWEFIIGFFTFLWGLLRFLGGG
jgi:hypothetical protein